MPEQLTVLDLLASQTERKLKKMHSGIVGEMERLGTELKLVEEALSRKQRGKRQEADPVVREQDVRQRPVIPKSLADGRFEGLSRDQLYAYVVEYGKPVKPQQMRNFLTHRKGIVRTTEAVRVALNRLAKDGRLTRLPEGTFAVPNGNGHRPTAEAPTTSGDALGSRLPGDGPGSSSAGTRSN